MLFKKTSRILFLLLLYISSLEASNYGSLLFHGNCITCHDETQTLSAPSVIDFREKYITAFPKREDFVNYMSEWVLHPKEETSIMLEAIEKYELMPELVFDIDTLKIISEYIYDTDFKITHEGHK